MGVHHLHVVLCGSQDKDKMADTPCSTMWFPQTKTRWQALPIVGSPCPSSLRQQKTVTVP